MADFKDPQEIVVVPNDPTALSPNHAFYELLPTQVPADLTPEEIKRAETLQNAFNILGPAAGGALVCPGNQLTTPDSEKCPYVAKCVYLQARKAPAGELCPIEAQEIQTRFLGWCRELNKNPMTLSEAERCFVAEMVWIQVQEYRCASIVARGKDARLTQLNPKETHPDTLEVISWERVIHANLELLDQLSNKRRLLMKDWMLTDEQKWKKDRASGALKSQDLSTKQAGLADRLRKLGRQEAVEESIPHNDGE